MIGIDVFTALALFSASWWIGVIAVPIHMFLQLRSDENRIDWRDLALVSIIIAACFGAVVAVGGMLDAGLVALVDGAVVFILLSIALLIGGVVGRILGWILNRLLSLIWSSW